MNETIESPVVGTNRMPGQRRAASSTRRMLAALGVATLGGLLIGEAGAAAGALDERALLERADFVFQGVVERVEYAFSDTRGGRNPRLPHTFVTYRIEDVLHGRGPDETITLRFIGGRGEEASFLLAGELPLFDVGDRDLMFVARNGTAGCPLVRCAEGRLRIVQDRIFNDAGQAVEAGATGALTLGAFFDLPEVMTHQVSQTLLRRRDHFDEGETRQAFDASASGAHLTAGELRDRVRALASTVSASAAQVRSADPSQPFTIPAFAPRPAPVERAHAAPAARARTAQERAELEVLARGDGNPVLGNANE